MGHNLQMSTWTGKGELEAEPFQKVNPDHLELKTGGVNDAASIWDTESCLLWIGAMKVWWEAGTRHGRQPNNTSGCRARWPPTMGWVLVAAAWAGRGAERPHGLPQRQWGETDPGAAGSWACNWMPRLLEQEMSETPRRLVQGLERKPSTLATIGRSEGGSRRNCLFAWCCSIKGQG